MFSYNKIRHRLQQKNIPNSFPEKRPTFILIYFRQTTVFKVNRITEDKKLRGGNCGKLVMNREILVGAGLSTNKENFIKMKIGVDLKTHKSTYAQSNIQCD